MDQKKQKKVYVIGHKNPDTDSICSAIAYANLKNKITGEKYIAKRAGEVNGETAYVLDKFQVSVPSLLDNVHLQVKDMDIRHIEGVSGHMSIKDAWARMKDENIKTLPVTRGEKLEGLITIGDIATSYMEVYDNNILATARTIEIAVVRHATQSIKSPSTRRAWIEMLRRSPDRSPRQVALHPEGVDRNANLCSGKSASSCRRPPPGGRG